MLRDRLGFCDSPQGVSDSTSERAAALTAGRDVAALEESGGAASQVVANDRRKAIILRRRRSFVSLATSSG